MSKRPSFPTGAGGGENDAAHANRGKGDGEKRRDRRDVVLEQVCLPPVPVCLPPSARSSSSPRLASFCPAVLPPGRLSGRGIPAANPFVAGPGPATPSHSKALGRKSVAKVEGGGKLKPEGLRKIKRGVGRRRPRSRNFKKIRQLRAVTVSGVRSRGFLV